MWWPTDDEVVEFTSPRSILSGRGSVAQLPRILGACTGLQTGASVIAAVDDAVRSMGLLDGMFASLEAAGFQVTIVGGFGTEPDDVCIDAAARTARKAHADAVVGIGGGSVLDSAKLIALLVRNEGSAADWVGAVEPPAGTAPLVLVPTTCGTGSECTRAAMVTVDGNKRISTTATYIPSGVVIDPALLDNLPPGIVAATGMDALSHAIEAMTSTLRSPMTTHHAVQAIALLTENLERAFQGDADARAACLWASHLAGRALNAGVNLGHSLAYCIAHEKPVPHGLTSAMATPYAMGFNASAIPEDCRRALALAITGGRSGDLAKAALQVRDTTLRLGMPVCLDDLGIEAGVEARMARQCVDEYPRPTNPAPMEYGDILRLFETMRTGDVDAAFAVRVREHA